MIPLRTWKTTTLQKNLKHIIFLNNGDRNDCLNVYNLKLKALLFLFLPLNLSQKVELMMCSQFNNKVDCLIPTNLGHAVLYIFS